ncbi:hypothetical protein PV458_02435 [Streptomyces sp. MN03-5084-2B]|nr:hypothetical protein [Streptomyces sp. MN03-5084-2B]
MLARVVSVKLLPAPWWHRGDDVLGLGLRAARRTGSRTDIAYFTYAPAARRADCGRVAEAAELLIALIDSATAHGPRRLADRPGALLRGPVDDRRLGRQQQLRLHPAELTVPAQAAAGPPHGHGTVRLTGRPRPAARRSGG